MMKGATRRNQQPARSQILAGDLIAIAPRPMTNHDAAGVALDGNGYGGLSQGAISRTVSLGGWQKSRIVMTPTGLFFKVASNRPFDLGSICLAHGRNGSRRAPAHPEITLDRAHDLGIGDFDIAAVLAQPAERVNVRGGAAKIGENHRTALTRKMGQRPAHRQRRRLAVGLQDRHQLVEPLGAGDVFQEQVADGFSGCRYLDFAGPRENIGDHAHIALAVIEQLRCFVGGVGIW